MTDSSRTPARAIVEAILDGGAIELVLGSDAPSATGGEIGGGEFDDALGEIDAAARADAPGIAPAFDPMAARWGLAQMAWLAQCLVDRRREPAEVLSATERVLGEAAPQPGNASHAWSVDLTLRYLKDLAPQVRAFAADDPVRKHYARLVGAWPLSSPVKDRGSEPAWDHPSLERLAKDRADPGGVQ